MTHSRIQEVLDVARERFDALASVADSIALLDLCHCFADNVASSRLPWCRPSVLRTDVVRQNISLDGRVESRDGDDNQETDSDVDGKDGERDDSDTKRGRLLIRGGRHLIDPTAIGQGGRNNGGEGLQGGFSFVPNDTYVPADKPFTVISGINGSGKSTYIKQIGIIVILSHIGSFVPAEQAIIPVSWCCGC